MKKKKEILCRDCKEPIGVTSVAYIRGKKVCQKCFIRNRVKLKAKEKGIELKYPIWMPK